MGDLLALPVEKKLEKTRTSAPYGEGPGKQLTSYTMGGRNENQSISF